MNAPKPKVSLAGQICPTCRKGTFELVQIDHTENVPGDNPITIHNIWVDRCNECGEVVFPGDTVQFVESVVAGETEQLTGHELERIRQDLSVGTQDEMSEILGLGCKTYHRWESGAQFPNRSMGYYLRILSEFPEAFEWLRNRSWRKANRIRSMNVSNLASRFPDLAWTTTRKGLTMNDLHQRILIETEGRRFNPAVSLRETKVL